MKSFFPVALVSLLLPLSSFAAQPTGYAKIPNASARAQADSGYVVFPDFPNLEIVKENEGTPNSALAGLITDPTIANKIQDGYFTSLQVRELALVPAGVYTAQNVLHIPFAVSVKHSQGSNTSLFNFNRGTIEVAGEFLVFSDGKSLNVEVVKFDDSQKFERLGRKLGYNADIKLDFARAVSIPVLKDYFNSDARRIALMIRLATPANGSLNLNQP